MSCADRILRVALGMLVATVVVVTPGIAQAAFSSAEGASVQIGTLKLVAPAYLKGAPVCKLKAGGLYYTSVNLTGFGPVTGATGYEVTLASGKGSSTTTTTGTSATVRVRTGATGSAGTWTVAVRGTRGTWRGEPLTRTFTCSSAGTATPASF